MRLSEEERYNIVLLHKQGLNLTQIAANVGCDRHDVRRWIDRYNETGGVAENQGRGRKRKLSEVNERAVEWIITGNQAPSIRLVAKRLKTEKKIDVSRETVRRTAHARGLTPFKKQRSSRLTKAHKKARLAFAKKYKDKDWSNVVFTDEHAFKQFRSGNSQHNFAWRHSREQAPTREVERWPITLNVWAGITLQGKSDLVFYQGGLNAQEYQNLLEKTLLPFASDTFEGGEIEWELQQDKATSHTAASTKKWLEDHNVDTINDWPTKGDDINPIENLWSIMDDKLAKRKFRTEKGMKKCLIDEWNKLDEEVVHNLIDSVPNRIRKVIKAKGGHTKNIK
jgi:transposase